jgi:hypothetical protein
MASEHAGSEEGAVMDDTDGMNFPGVTPDDGMPPSWLDGLLDPDECVLARDPFEAVLRSLPQARFPVRMRRAMWGVPTTFFAVVDACDGHMVMSLHALVTEMEDRCGGAWWTMEDPGWVRDEPRIRPGHRLRWLALDMVGDLIVQLEGYFRRFRRACQPEALRRDMRKAMLEESAEHLDLDPGYVQWAGYPGGLHLEVGDGNLYDQPFDEALWSDLRWLGWEPPGIEERNAWFEAFGPDAPDVGADLVVRTLEVLAEARTRRRRDAGLDPRPVSVPVSRALLERQPALVVGPVPGGGPSGEPGDRPPRLATVTPEEGSP